jgi:CPA2 family monovalent cation:H+ antiporter-2
MVLMPSLAFNGIRGILWGWSLKSHFSHRAEEETLPLREIFRFYFSFLWECCLIHIFLSNNHCIFWLLSRLLWWVKHCCNGIGFILPLSNQYSFDCRASLAQIGEFSFILATLVSLGLLTLEAQNLILAGALFSITLTLCFLSN